MHELFIDLDTFDRIFLVHAAQRRYPRCALPSGDSRRSHLRSQMREAILFPLLPEQRHPDPALIDGNMPLDMVGMKRLPQRSAGNRRQKRQRCQSHSPQYRLIGNGMHDSLYRFGQKHLPLSRSAASAKQHRSLLQCASGNCCRATCSPFSHRCTVLMAISDPRCKQGLIYLLCCARFFDTAGYRRFIGSPVNCEL